MVERIEGMPGDTLGFRLSGKLDRDEYFRILDPVKEKLERGEQVSFLVETAPDFYRSNGGTDSSRSVSSVISSRV